jgi:hypothetical protein
VTVFANKLPAIFVRYRDRWFVHASNVQQGRHALDKPAAGQVAIFLLITSINPILSLFELMKST